MTHTFELDPRQGATLPGASQAQRAAEAQARRDDLRRPYGTEQGSVAALMSSRYSTVSESLDCAAALATLRGEAVDAHSLQRIYVLDEQRQLLGTLSLGELLLAEARKPVSALMITPVISACITDTQEQIARLISHYDLLAVPIVNRSGQMIGIVGCDDAMDVVVEEATEDFHKGALIGTRIGNLKTATIGLLYRKRVLWLVLLVFGNLFSRT
jgi:magnesium transporter